MKKRILMAAVITAFAGAAFAAKPTSIVYVQEVPVGNEIYAQFKVKCSDNTEKDVSAWDNRKLWCQGIGTKDDCDKKQIASAKKACK